jgi:hypothetical protein
VWADTDEGDRQRILDEMQAQWLLSVGQECAVAAAGLTLKSAHAGHLPPRILVHIPSFVFGGSAANEGGRSP